MAGSDEDARDRGDAAREARFAAVREVLQRDVVATEATETLTALVDALDRCQRRAPVGVRDD